MEMSGLELQLQPTKLDIAGSASLSGNLAFNGTGTNNVNLLNGSNLNFVTSPAGEIGNNPGDVGIFSTAGQGQLPQDISGHTTVTAIIGGQKTYIYVLESYQ